MNNLRWLHLSDLYINTQWTNDSPFFQSLLEDIHYQIKDKSLNFIFVTGDIVYSGQKDQYQQAKVFFDALLASLKLQETPTKLYVIPGNHDVDWRSIPPGFEDYLVDLTKEKIDSYWQEENYRKAISSKFQNYNSFSKHVFSKQSVSNKSELFFVDTLAINDRKIAIIGLNSVWLSVKNPFRNLAVIGSSQFAEVLEKSKDADIKIGLIHHPPALLWKGDQHNVIPLLQQECNFILHGHSHTEDFVSTIFSSKLNSTIIGSGQSTRHGKIDYTYNIVNLDFDNNFAKATFRRYSSRSKKFIANAYPLADEGKIEFNIPEYATPIEQSPITSNEISFPLKDREITIMHLSDIQFGRHHTNDGNRMPLYKDDKSYSDELVKIQLDIKRVKEAYGISPDLIAVTGDIAEWSIEPEYIAATTFLSGIAKECDLPHRRVQLIPGNHDINRKLCLAARLTAEAKQHAFTQPFFEKFEFFQEFFNSFYRNCYQINNQNDVFEFNNNLYINYFYPELGVTLLGLNSCVAESEKDTDHYGLVTIDQINRAFTECNQKDPERKMLRIALVHHNFKRGSSVDNENLKDADELEIPLLSNNVRLILHGHQHIPLATTSGIPGNSIHVLSTGSAGLDSDTLPQNSRRYQYISIKGNTVLVYRRRYEHQSRDSSGNGCWVPDPLPEDSLYNTDTPATLTFEL